MPILGAHQSMAGGYYKAVEAARRVGCDCVQLFTKNNNQWRAKPITDAEVAAFRRALAELNITNPIAHDSYLINLASPDAALWQKSVDAFVEELERAETLGIPYVVTHPGAATGTSEEDGLRRVIKALDEVHRRTRGLGAQCLLETTAGQGSSLGWRFEHLARIQQGVQEPERLGVCFDTCHVHAAGYPLSTQAAYDDTMEQLDRTVGLELVRAFHLNDSRKELGSRVDRHAHIGEGSLGLEAFRLLLNDEHFAGAAMYLETPKETVDGVERDVTNLATLRGLIGRTTPCRAKRRAGETTRAKSPAVKTLAVKNATKRGAPSHGRKGERRT